MNRLETLKQKLKGYKKCPYGTHELVKLNEEQLICQNIACEGYAKIYTYPWCDIRECSARIDEWENHINDYCLMNRNNVKEQTVKGANHISSNTRLSDLKKEEAKWLKQVQERIKNTDSEFSFELDKLNYTRCRIDELERRNKEILDVLNKFKKQIECEIPYAERANTDNGKQSILIYNLILHKISMLKRELGLSEVKE